MKECQRSKRPKNDSFIFIHAPAVFPTHSDVRQLVYNHRSVHAAKVKKEQRNDDENVKNQTHHQALREQNNRDGVHDEHSQPKRDGPLTHVYFNVVHFQPKLWL